MYVLSCQQMRDAEQAALAAGSATPDGLMDAAISSAVAELQRDAEYSEIHRTLPHVVVYMGKGKNAGDALGIARSLGYPCIPLRCAAPAEQMAPETRRQMELTETVADVRTSALPLSQTPDGTLIIDGLLGSGARGSLRPEYAQLVHEMNALRRTNPRSSLLAVDIPTGLLLRPSAV